MLTTTVAKSQSKQREERLLAEIPEHFADIAEQESPLSRQNLKKLYLYTSVIGVVLVVSGLLLAINYQHVLMIECFKALSIISVLNLIRSFSIS